MIRVDIWVEGQTEETFVHKVLRSYFSPFGVCLYPRLFGGICEYPRARRDILNTLKETRDCFCTTMVDYYGMPSSWPDREAAKQKPFAERARTIEQAVLADISAELGSGFDCARFIPYVQMHEFEALLFSAPKLLADGLELSDHSAIQSIRDQFASPEEINDSQQTAPSKRIIQLCPGYDKKLDGFLISQKIGLGAMRAECSHFNEWVRKLEALAGR